MNRIVAPAAVVYLLLATLSLPSYADTADATGGVDMLKAFPVLGMVIVIYFLPSLVAGQRQHHPGIGYICFESASGVDGCRLGGGVGFGVRSHTRFTEGNKLPR
jgi:hypothetical protein